MNSDRIYERLTAIMRDVFDEDDVVARPELTADRVAGWDSFGHLRFIFRVEQEFGISFATAQISSFRNVGELAETIAAKTGR